MRRFFTDKNGLLRTFTDSVGAPQVQKKEGAAKHRVLQHPRKLIHPERGWPLEYSLKCEFTETIYKRDRPGTWIFNMNVLAGATVSQERL